MPATVVAAPGTQALIQLLPRLVGRSRVAILGPTYAEHELCWRRHGHDVAVVADLAAAAGADVVVVVNPDNPTGRLLRRRRCAALDIGCWWSTRPSSTCCRARRALPATCRTTPWCCARSARPTDWPALRLGFAIAPLRLAARLRDELGPWAVSGPALAIGARRACRRRLAEGDGNAPRRDRRRTRRAAGRGGIHDPGRNDAVRLGEHPEAHAPGRTPGPAGHPRPRLRRSADLARFDCPRRRRIRRLATALGIHDLAGVRLSQVPQNVWQTRCSAGGGSA